MAKKLYTESDIQNIAAAIRARNGTSNTYKVSQMAGAIQAMTTKPVLPAGTKFKGSWNSNLGDFLSACNLSQLGQMGDMSEMFAYCGLLNGVPLFDTSSATTMTAMFRDCNTNLTTVPQFNTANVESMWDMFNGCSVLRSVPLFNMTKVTKCERMFQGCVKLASVPQFDMRSVTDCSNMFQDCRALTTAPAFTFGSLDKCAYMFNDCTALTSVSLFDTSTCTDVGAMFNGCSALVTIPQFDYRNVTSFGSTLSSTKMYDGCTSLSNASLNNILASMAGATSFSGGLLKPKTLKFLGLTRAQATICEGLSNFAAFTAAGWSTGY